MKRGNNSRSQRLIVIGSLLGVVLTFFGAVYQSYRNEELSLAVSALENRQDEKIEQNKRSIASISVLSAPARIDTLAQQDDHLKSGYPANALIINTAIAAGIPSTAVRGAQTSSAPGTAGGGTGSGSVSDGSSGNSPPSRGSGGGR